MDNPSYWYTIYRVTAWYSYRFSANDNGSPPKVSSFPDRHWRPLDPVVQDALSTTENQLVWILGMAVRSPVNCNGILAMSVQ